MSYQQEVAILLLARPVYSEQKMLTNPNQPKKRNNYE